MHDAPVFPKHEIIWRNVLILIDANSDVQQPAMQKIGLFIAIASRKSGADDLGTQNFKFTELH
ncbi:MAG: hypothetical protein ACJAU6_002614 [Alphaproteobacteria bacterium]